MTSKNEHDLGSLKNLNPSNPITNHSAMSNSKSGVVIPDTPRSLRSFGGDAGLVDLRPTIAKEMDGEIVECSVEDFITTYLPFAPNEEQTQRLVQQLLQEQPPAGGKVATRSTKAPRPSILVGNKDQYTFRSYPNEKGDVKLSSHGSENVAFRGWSAIAEAIAAAAPAIGRQVTQFKYHDIPNKRIASDILGSNNRIDAGFIRNFAGTSSEPRTTDIAVVVEFKLATNLKQANARQAVSANVQIMNDDEPHLLIKVLAAFTFATEEQLGYDPLITREQDGRYTFNLPDPTSSGPLQQFRTIGTLSEYRTNNITGRMARVYTVNKLDPEGKPVGEPLVLKDVWLDESAQTEWEIQKEIFKDIEKFWASSTDIQGMKELHDTHKRLVTSGEYKKYFLEIVLDHVGTVTTSRPAASTPKPGLLFSSTMKTHNPNISSTNNVTPQGTGTSSTSVFSGTRNTNAGTHPIEFDNVTPVPVAERPFKPKKRYQVVFKDVCLTVGQLTTLGEVVRVLRQTLIPLHLLLCAGWVHRDISSGNIMAHRADLKAAKQPWQAKLADLEYAKKFPSLNDREAGDPKTGTPYFMPLEIMLKHYLFDPRTQEHRDAVARGDKPKPSKDKVRDKKKQKGDVSSQPDPTRHVIHNFQHDLESLWWILLWTVTCRIDSEAAFAYGRPIFVNQIIPTHERRKCFKAKSIVKELERFLPLPKTEDDDTLAEMIDNLRDFMNDAYVARISEGNEDKPEHYVEIFDNFTFCFNVIENTASDWADIPLIVRTATQAQPESVVPGRRKRTREEESIDARQVDGDERSEAKLPKTEESDEEE
ncbi:hypothetical protein JR316_0002597 [Psilocybe cubensis]|uniref:Uncharacterized protein n=1 Tax=Psilocybe cubensis TaxID=181762 RepID=A0ACB8HD99_PSICU|nr:hypothetical protein JR316_0002597 [Psilocybe cubensis]KAH9485687.1 hypothetical protein JR316_0002597 [Psilocybe cubensis]